MYTRKIIVLLFGSVHLLDIAGAVQVFYEAKNLCQVPLQFTYTAVNQKIISEQGLQFCELLPLKNIQVTSLDLICIPGIDFRAFKTGKLFAEINQAKDWITNAYENGASICSICSGSLILAEMNLLNYKKCTSHWKCLDYMKEKYPKINLQSAKIYTEDRRIYTSAGMTAGIDLALYLLEKWFGAFVLASVAQEMIVGYRREADSKQQGIFSNINHHFHPDIYKVQEILLNHPEQNPTIDQLAEAVNLSPRHLTRVFRKHTGKTIQAYKNEIRLELGKTLLQNDQLTIEEIAQRCGFNSGRQFRRIWKTTFGVSPTRFREN